MNTLIEFEDWGQPFYFFLVDENSVIIGTHIKLFKGCKVANLDTLTEGGRVRIHSKEQACSFSLDAPVKSIKLKEVTAYEPR